MGSAAGYLPLAAMVVLTGTLLVQMLPSLVPVLFLPAGLLVALLVSRRWPVLWPLLALLVGFAWTDYRADRGMDLRLPEQLAGRDFDVVGRVIQLPAKRKGVLYFAVKIRDIKLQGRRLDTRGRLHLAWYGAEDVHLEPCQIWQLKVRLKPPRSMLNPGGFDSEKSALQHHLMAVGYVREEGHNRLVDAATWCIDKARAHVSRALARSLAGSPEIPLLQALAVGDQRHLSDHHWQVARVTGISHLLAISGFHIGVVGLFGAWFAGFLWCWLPRRWQSLPRQNTQAMAALVAALGYGLMAGMGLPTQRTLVMIAVVCIARCTRRRIRAVDSLALALLAVLAWDPLAVLSAGLWLSFAGVAFLVFGMFTTRGWMRWVAELGYAQLLMTVSLLPLTVWFFGQASLVGAVANLVAVPLISLLVVPLLLVGVLALPGMQFLSAWVWQAAAWLIGMLWQGLEWLADLPWAAWYLPQAGPISLVLAVLGAVWLLWPRGLPARWLGCLLFLPLLAPVMHPPRQGGFRVTLLDVGQGLSVLVQTQSHALLYDAGARYPSGFDLGEAVVVPALHEMGVLDLDRMVISHADNDHSGGALAVRRAWPEVQVLGSQPDRSPMPMQPCRYGQTWLWDGVRFRFLHPQGFWPKDNNDGSCVLLVSGTGGRLLLPGDVSRLIEPMIAERIPAGPPLVLVVPHHGSNSSSRAEFLKKIDPVMALVSAGWHNHFGHPAKAVLLRYRKAGIPLYNTANAGAMVLDVPPRNTPRLSMRIRCDRHRYWRPSACSKPPN